jgi:hypothetical protein|tara:strand:- start:265 stop:519 length:255 start_codon:yes stop_codon:yes gene_type:complete
MAKKEIKTIYVHEIVTIWSENGEVMIQTCNDDIIVFNGENLFNDIPSLMTVALKERRKQEELTLELIESGLNDIRKEKKLIEKN